MNVNDKVRYKTSWLRAVGAFTGDICHAVGTITELKDYSSFILATVAWDKPNIPDRVNIKNLEKVP